MIPTGRYDRTLSALASLKSTPSIPLWLVLSGWCCLGWRSCSNSRPFSGPIKRYFHLFHTLPGCLCMGGVCVCISNAYILSLTRLCRIRLNTLDGCRMTSQARYTTLQRDVPSTHTLVTRGSKDSSSRRPVRMENGVSVCFPASTFKVLIVRRVLGNVQQAKMAILCCQ